MTTTRGKLVAGRVKQIEYVFNVANPCVTLCSYTPPTLHQQLVQSTSENNNRHKWPLRPAPAVPLQPRLASATPTSALAAAATAEAARPLLPTLNQQDALSLLDAAHVTERVEKSGHTEVNYTVLQELPPVPPSTTPWGNFRDRLFAVASRYENTIPTKRSEFKLTLLIFLGCLLFLVLYSRVFRASEDTNPIELDEYFQHLNYSADQLLVYQGETLKGVPKEGISNENKCIVIERRKQRVSNGKSEVGVVASNEHRTFPGSLLLANSHLVDNSPDLLAVDRAPLTYTVNLPGLTTDGSFTIVPSFSEYQAAVNKVLNTWFENYPRDWSTAANFQSDESFAFSKQLLRVKFGLDFMDSVIESLINFNAMGKGEKLIKIYKYTQVFYTVSVEPTKKPSDLFDSGVTLSEIKRKTDEKNPPVLVDSVSYGRKIYVKIETTSIEKQAELNLAFMDSKPGLQIAHDLKDLNIQIYVIGGHTNQTELIDVKEMNEVHDIIKKFSKFSKNNLGFPISYSSQFINDNKKAIVHLSTDYVESVRHDNCRKGIIKLIQRPWFCKWEVTWTEYSYDENGNKTTKKRGWDKNSRIMKLSFDSEDIEIPIYVEDLTVVAETLTVFDSWRTVIDRSNIPIIPRREFYIHNDLSSEIRPPLVD